MVILVDISHIQRTPIHDNFQQHACTSKQRYGLLCRITGLRYILFHNICISPLTESGMFNHLNTTAQHCFKINELL